jgi:lysophospholipase L1-like esterase
MIPAGRRKTMRWLVAAGYLVALAVWALASAYSADVVQAIYDGRAETFSEVEIPLRFYQARFDGGLNAALVAWTGLSLLALGLLSRISWLRVTASNLAIFVFLVIGAEVGIRALGFEFERIARTGLTDRGVWSYDATKGWFHQPHTTGRSFLGGPDRGAIRINALGLRDRELTLAKPSGVKRILVFGDSYVFGVGIDPPNLFTTRLQALLDEGSDQIFEVINLGVSGYSTDQEYLLFRELGVQLDPDVIVLVACANDPGANIRDFAYARYYKPYFALDDSGELQLGNAEVPQLTLWQSVKLWLCQESEFWNFLRSRRSDVAALQAALHFFRVAAPSFSGDDPIVVTAAILRRFAQEAEAMGVPMLVTTTAGRAGIDDGQGSMRSADAELAALLGDAPLDWLDLWPILIRAREAEPEKHWDFDPNQHWNVDAHRVAAEAVHWRLRASGML